MAILGLGACTSPGSSSCPEISLRSQSSDPAPALVVQAMFDAMRSHDVEGLRALVLPGAQIVRAQRAPGGELLTAVVSDTDFVQGTAGSEATIDERWIGTPQARVEGPMASVWGRYEVWVDGEYQHCGIDAVHLVEAAAGWQVASVTYTAGEEGCTPHSAD